MDIISQLQEQVNCIALIALNTFGTLQRDAPPVRLSPNYPEPPANTTEETINTSEQPKEMSAALVQAAKKNLRQRVVSKFIGTSEIVGGLQVQYYVLAADNDIKEATRDCFNLFDALVAVLPINGGEEAQLKRIAELQAENEAVGFELQKQLEAAEQELKQVQSLFSQASDNCLNLKKPD